MATAADLRRIALSLDGTAEYPHFDRRAFKAVRTYVTLAADEDRANIKFTPEHQEFKCLLAPDVYRRIPNEWGRQGWTVMKLAKLTEDELRADLQTAHVGGSAKKRAPRTRRPS